MFESLPVEVSPFKDKLGTNYIPTEDEITNLRALLVHPTEELAQIDAQIDAMDVLISQLRAKRTYLKTTIDAHTALISPMRRIPDDILREIFVTCLPTAPNLIDPAEAPILLGCICRHWRAVAHTTPILWSSIHIPALPRVSAVHGARILSRVLERWLQRAATCPVTVSVTDNGLHDSHPDTNLISLLINCSQRLQHLALVGDTGVLLPFLRLPPESLPLLQSIRLHVRGDSPFTEYPDAMNVLQIPSLTAIAFKVKTNPLSLPLKWAQLTGLNLDCAPHGQEVGLNGIGALDMLRRCPNLLHCQLRLTKMRDDPDLALNTSPITLPRLHILILRGSAQFPTWIPHLAVPKLRCLHVGEREDIQRFANISSAYGPYVKAALDTSSFTASGLLEVLESFPMITHLHLSSNTFRAGTLSRLDDTFLQHLSSVPDLCPTLTHLCFTVPCPVFSDATALAFIGTCMARPTPLQLFEAHFLREMQIDIMPDLEPFIASGLEVKLKYRVRRPRRVIDPHAEFETWLSEFPD